MLCEILAVMVCPCGKKQLKKALLISLIHLYFSCGLCGGGGGALVACFFFLNNSAKAQRDFSGIAETRILCTQEVLNTLQI